MYRSVAAAIEGLLAEMGESKNYRFVTVPSKQGFSPDWGGHGGVSLDSRYRRRFKMGQHRLLKEVAYFASGECNIARLSAKLALFPFAPAKNFKSLW